MNVLIVLASLLVSSHAMLQYPSMGPMTFPARKGIFGLPRFGPVIQRPMYMKGGFRPMYNSGFKGGMFAAPYAQPIFQPIISRPIIQQVHRPIIQQVHRPIIQQVQRRPFQKIIGGGEGFENEVIYDDSQMIAFRQQQALNQNSNVALIGGDDNIAVVSNNVAAGRFNAVGGFDDDNTIGNDEGFGLAGVQNLGLGIQNIGIDNGIGHGSGLLGGHGAGIQQIGGGALLGGHGAGIQNLGQHGAGIQQIVGHQSGFPGSNGGGIQNIGIQNLGQHGAGIQQIVGHQSGGVPGRNGGGIQNLGMKGFGHQGVGPAFFGQNGHGIQNFHLLGSQGLGGFGVGHGGFSVSSGLSGGGY